MLWLHWWNVLWRLRSGCSRLSTFLWFALSVAGFCVRTELLGVTSIIRALGLHEKHYDSLRENFHSQGIQLNPMTAQWARIVMTLFPGLLKVNGRLVLVGDGIKVPKQGKKMPAVKWLHQSSESNTKAQYITGHSFQAIAILMQASATTFAVPLALRIHEGVVLSNRDQRSLLDKMIALMNTLAMTHPCYFVADAYYASQKIANGLFEQGHHLISRAKSNAVAYLPPPIPKEPRKRGRPKKYGQKVALKTLFNTTRSWEQMPSPVYGEKEVNLRYRVCDLLWRPLGRLVRFVLVAHPTRGVCILMSTDTSLSAAEIIRLYGLRFKIEHAFKQAVRLIGTFSYHFWMRAMKPISRRKGNQYLHRETKSYRQGVLRKMNAYHVFVFAGVVAHGLLQYLSCAFPDLVWRSFGSWLRTIRPGIAPSELVVMNALRHTLPEFLLNNSDDNNLAKFIVERLDYDRITPLAQSG